MKFQNLKYWREKASHRSPGTRLFASDECCTATGNRTFITLDPAGQRPPVKVARGKKADMGRAVATACTVFKHGDRSQALPTERKAVLHKLADLMEQHRGELAPPEALDTGKPIRRSLHDDIPGTAHAIRWYAEAIDKVYGEIATTLVNDLALTVHEPAGVITATIPWNFLLLLTCWKLDPALATGNNATLKPSEKSPLTAIHLAVLAKKADLPDGVLSVVSGYSREAGQALSQYPDVDMITFTDSTRAGKQLLKDADGNNMKRVWPKAGGKSANTVFANCLDLSKAATNAAAGIFYNQGQVCIAGTHLLLEESIADEFIALPEEQVKNRQPGNPLDPKTTMGTLIDNAHASIVRGFIRDGEAQGMLALDGRSHVHPATIGPTIFIDAASQTHVSRDKTFGPVLVITRFSSETEALALANDSDYGLGAAIWTRDLSRACRMNRRLKADLVFVSNYSDGDITVPFGGYKQNGNRRDKSLRALEKFGELKTTWTSLES